MAPLTWRNVDSPSFASANQLYSLSAELMNRGFSAASRGLDKFREITTDEQSARLMQDVMAAGNDPAAIQQAATRGNAAFLSPEALRFANAQPGVLLDRQQTGLRSDIMQYGLDRSKVTDGRQDTAYNAQQEANPLIYQAQQLARQGDLSGAQAIVSANADLFSRAGINASNLYGDLSGGFTGQMQDTERGVQHDDFMRIAGNAGNARELIDLAGRAFGTEAEARRGIQDLQAQGLINADLAQTALGSLGASGLWTAPTAADEIMQRYGATPMNGRGSTNPSWATSNNPVLNGFMSTVQRGGVTNPYALAAIQATGQHESGFDPGNAGRTWNDPSESGRPGTAGGIMSWNNDRLAALQRFTGGDMSPEAQAAYFLQEDPQLIARLNNAGSVEEAQALMNNAWRFAGYDRPGGEAENRLNTARSIYNGTPLSFGSNVPRVGTQPGASQADQMLAAAINNPNRTALAFGPSMGTQMDTSQADQMFEATVNNTDRIPLTFGDGIRASLADQMLAATINNPNPTPLSFGDQSEISTADLMLAARINDTDRTPLTFGNQSEISLADQMLAATINNPNPTSLTYGDHPGVSLADHIIETGTAGDNPLFTEVQGGVVARPPMSREETLLIARAAREGILQIAPERASRQAEIDRASEMMQEAGGRTPDVSVRPERTDGTGFQNDLNAMMRNGDISGGINRIADGIATGQYGPAGSPIARGFGGLLDYFSASPEEAQRNSADREAASEAIGWWRSPEARSYFEQNPDELQMASRNPVLFARQMAERTPGQTPSQQQDQRQQTPARNQNGGQQPAATPTSLAPVKPEDLASFIQTAANTGNADRANDLHAALDRAVVEGDSGDTNLGELASRLRTEEGGLSDYSHQDIEGALNRIRSELGVSLPVAAELLGDSRKYEGTDWNPLNWGGDLQYDMGDIRDRWKLYDQGNSSNAARLQAAVARLNNRDTSQSASQGIAQVQTDYEALVTAMNQQITQASTQAERDAIREHFERNVFPLLYKQVQAIGATGALTTYSGTRTDQ